MSATLLLLFTSFIMSALLSYALVPFVKNLAKKTGLFGVDVHKSWRPLIPKIGGITIFIGVTVSVLITSFLFNMLDNRVLAFIISTELAAIVGLWEDFRELNPVLKPVLLALVGLPIVFMGAYYPYPNLPFVGKRALTILYPILVPIAFTVVTNAVNSMDVLNGSMTFTSLVATSTIFLITLIKGNILPAYLCAGLIGSLMVFAYYNKYPAKLFPGNVGSLYVGASLISVAIIGSVEIALLVAILPQITNEFHIIYSMRGLRSAKNLSERPVFVENGMLTANPSKKAPLTLVRMLTSKCSLSESEVVKMLVIISIFSAILALITEFFFIK
ncbi:MAG: hypothetical protein LZ158_02000 [Thaumarchaeota archaeon]|nr:hypothetical protein [Candidatus Terraquivivens yellowstonensis]MCL7392908.1 hypothetical protein [Candidatus Terraquivivens yellowstonensis]MCL7397653.1 hypothetical protein [Candidatus Terraquivivens yellowstonensis]MCL7399053.1 hypothetical protein [Candidatus Terraquivivens yellowstonensis]MCL7400613.1 hypothetical protein [Candidatus Terraquivivens yellowstonensis]